MNKMLMNALPGKYRTALCTGCNLNRKNQLFIPLYCHNFRGFDSHLILHSLDLLLDKARFSSLSRNSEQIITMSIGMWKFIDTMSFMPSSLEKLADLLKNNDREKLVHTKQLAGENMVFSVEKGSIHTNTWTAFQNCKREASQKRRHFTLSFLEEVFLMLPT